MSDARDRRGYHPNTKDTRVGRVSRQDLRVSVAHEWFWRCCSIHLTRRWYFCFVSSSEWQDMDPIFKINVSIDLSSYYLDITHPSAIKFLYLLTIIHPSISSTWKPRQYLTTSEFNMTAFHSIKDSVSFDDISISKYLPQRNVSTWIYTFPSSLDTRSSQVFKSIMNSIVILL